MSEVAAETTAPPPEEVGSWRVLLRSFATLALGEGGARVFGLVGVLILARRLGPTNFGVISFGLSLVGWFALVSDSGTELLNVRNIAREPYRFREITERVLGLRLAISVIAAGVFAVVVQVFARSNHVRDVVVLFAFMLPVTALNLRWMVLGVRGAKAIAIGNIAARAVLAAGIVAVVAGPQDIKRVPFLELGGEAVYAIVIAVAVARRFGFVRPRVDIPYWIDTLRQSLPLAGSAAARAAFYAFDVIAIELFLGPQKVGIYAAGSKPVLFVTSAIGLFSLSFLSSFSAAGESDSEHGLLRKAVRLSMLVSIPLAAVLSAASIVVVPLVFGSAYRGAAGVLSILAWRIPVTAVASPYGSALIAHGRQLTLMKNSIASAVCLVVADLAVIPTFGVLGAAAVSAVCSTVGLVLNVRAVRRTTHAELAPGV